MIGVRQQIGGVGNLLFKQAYIMGEVMKGNLPDVYLQGEHYWKEYAPEIKLAFSQNIKPNGFVGLHIRRGDYLQAHNFHTNLWETDYYQKAVALFPTERFLVFCKDNQYPEQDKADRIWCREHLPALLGAGRFEMAPYEDTEVEDLNLLAGCESIIMANSSFSWWGAYLGEHEKVITPAQWFVDGNQRTELLDSWIKL